MAVAAACGGAVDVEAEVLIAFAVEVGCLGLGVVAERSLQAGNLYPCLVGGIGVVAANDTPEGDVVVGHGTAADGHAQLCIAFLRQFNLQIMRVVLNSGSPGGVPICGLVSVDQLVGALFGSRLFVGRAGEGRAELAVVGDELCQHEFLGLLELLLCGGLELGVSLGELLLLADGLVGGDDSLGLSIVDGLEVPLRSAGAGGISVGGIPGDDQTILAVAAAVAALMVDSAAGGVVG